MSRTAIESISTTTRYMPLKAPFVTARGRTDRARSFVIELKTTGGLTAYGALTPAEYVTHESDEDVAKSLAAIAEAVKGADVSDYEALFAMLAAEFPAAHAVRAGFEIAVMDAYGQSVGQPLWRVWGGKKPVVRTDLTVPINTLDEARTIARDAAALGIQDLKIKIDGTDPRTALARIKAVSEAAPKATLLVDANQSFTADGAIAFLDICRANSLEMALFEQPVKAADIAGLVKVAAYGEYPVGADEAVVTPADCRAILDTGGVQIVNIKLMKSGISGALEIIRMCQAADVMLMLGCMIESHVGIAASVHLACGTGAFSYLDLDAPLLLAGDIAGGGFTLDVDRFTPGERPGLGARLLSGQVAEA
ncbi:MAG TPA: dipeptide epimerase [Armatimonadota bacterium]